MSEEERFQNNMDKSAKSACRSAAVPKSTGVIDNGTNNINKYSKKSRRRENGPQSGPKPRSDNQPSSRRPPHQFADKRPRARGYYNDHQREEVTEDLRTEHGSVLRMGSKKTNLNRLLNFSVMHSEGDHYDLRYTNSGGYRGGRGKRWPKKSSVRFNKEQFLQANCQFVVKDAGDYTVNSVDPDTLVDWDLIEQVKIFGNQVPSCPICLYPPVAAKITRCGHIYCWACMLHYLSLSEKKTWRKCPICYEAVHKNDLKSVVPLETHTYKVGEEITMSLMKREKGTTYAMPVRQWASRESKPHNLNDTVDLCFSKLLLAGPEQVQGILDAERKALENQMREEGESLEGSYVQAALETLKERQVGVNLSKAAKESADETLEDLRNQTAKGAEVKSGSSFAPLGKDLVEYSSAFSDEELSHSEYDTSEVSALPVVQSAPDLQQAVSSSASEDIDDPDKESSAEGNDDNSSPTVSVATADGVKIEVGVEEVAEELVMPSVEENSTRNGSESSTQGGAAGGSSVSKRQDHFYFYQAIDGQHIYIHSLNARCLVKEYGSLDRCPETITARIVELEGISMTEDLRSRLRYLNHLPLTCEFKVAELAIKPPVLSRETLNLFGADIEKRKKMRQRKHRDENRQLKKMQQVEIKKYEHCPEMKMLVGNVPQFPELSTKIVQSEMPTLLAKSDSPRTMTPDITPIGSPGSEILLGSSGSDDGGQTSLSFAQMLRAGKMKAQPAWSVGSKPDTGSGTDQHKSKGGESDSENEDRVPVPLYRESFGDAISEALMSYTNKKTGGKDDHIVAEPNQGAGAKKKKKQKKLLFTTTMARNK